MAGGLERISRQRRDRDRWKPDQALEGALHRVKSAWVVDPAQVVPALFTHVARLDQGHPGAVGKEVGRRPEAGAVLLVVGGRNRDRDVVPAVKRALRFRVERANGFHLVAEELDPDRLGGVHRKDVEDAAPETELAGDLDDFGPHHPPLQQPRRQFLDGQVVTHADPP